MRNFTFRSLLTFALLASQAGMADNGRILIARPVLRPPPKVSFKAVKLSTINAANKPDVDLRNRIQDYGLAIRNQKSRGTCSVFAMTFMIEYGLAEWTGQKSLDLSEEYLNWAANMYTPSAVDGGFFSELNTGYQGYGMVTEKAFPYQDAFSFETVPSALVISSGRPVKRLKFEAVRPWDGTYGATNDQIRAATTAILLGMPVAWGSGWQKDTTDMVTVEGLNFIKTGTAAEMTAGHSVVLVGFKYSSKFAGGGYFVFRNSWDQSFGDDGYAYVTFDHIMRYTADLYYYRQ